jgi:putative flippase GtrA
MDLKIKLLKQIMRFGIVGGSAAFVNFSIVVMLVESGVLQQPLYANMVAFVFAFQVSYFGHRYWTFSDTVTEHRVAMTRLLLVSGTNFFANEGLFYFFLNTFQMPYMLALLLVLAILPIVTFTFSKLWVFR